MAPSTMLATVTAALLCLIGSASAFVVIGAGLGAAQPRIEASSSGRTAAGPRPLYMASRYHAKKEKAKRNMENMRRFRKRGPTKKKLVKGARVALAREKEAEFMAALFTYTGDDANAASA